MLNKIEILGSSSSGCAYVLYFENGKVIQLDAGIDNPKQDKVNDLYISHQNHTDHDKYLNKFYKDKVNIILPFDGERKEDNFESFKVPHKVLNNGYIIKEDNEIIGYITDCGDYSKVEKDLRSCTILFIECNWDYFLIKQGIIPSSKYGWSYAFTKQGHMSNLDCINALAKGKVNKNCKIIFVHKSTKHANYETTYKIFESLPNKTHIAKPNEIIYVKSGKVI